MMGLCDSVPTRVLVLFVHFYVFFFKFGPFYIYIYKTTWKVRRNTYQ
jgi:hypothetical protein